VLAAGPRPRRVAEVLALADPQAQSVLESVARVLLVLGGVSAVVSQVHVLGVGWVDLMIDGWLVVELDGWEFHREKFREDRRRDAELSRQGLVVLRFTYADLMHRREWFVEVVREVLDRGRPPFGLMQSATA
jgi:very-short-patch-repair endonuclease